MQAAYGQCNAGQDTLSLARLATVFWRPLCGMGVMELVVVTMEYLWTGTAGFFADVVRLLATVLCGAAAYASTVLASWKLAGKPEGAEQLILGRLWPLVQRRLVFVRKDQKA